MDVIISNLLQSGVDTFFATLRVAIIFAIAPTVLTVFGQWLNSQGLALPNIKAENTKPSTGLLLAAVRVLCLFIIGVAGHEGLKLAGHGYTFVLPDELIASLALAVFLFWWGFVWWSGDTDLKGIVTSGSEFVCSVFVFTAVSATQIANYPTIDIPTYTVILVVSGMTAAVFFDNLFSYLDSVQVPEFFSTKLQEA